VTHDGAYVTHLSQYDTGTQPVGISDVVSETSDVSTTFKSVEKGDERSDVNDDNVRKNNF
jgi:hypothetical protein